MGFKYIPLIFFTYFLQLLPSQPLTKMFLAFLAFKHPTSVLANHAFF